MHAILKKRKAEFCQREDRVQKCAPEKVALKSAGVRLRGGRKGLVDTVSSSEAQLPISCYEVEVYSTSCKRGRDCHRGQ